MKMLKLIEEELIQMRPSDRIAMFFYLLKYLKKMYNIDIISNLPTIMLATSSNLENESRFTDVIPALIPVVEIAEDDSNSVSSKPLFVVKFSTSPVIKAIEI
jgi:hypothetical protein